MIMIEGMKSKAIIPDKHPAFRWDSRDYIGAENLKVGVAQRYDIMDRTKDIVVRVISTTSLTSERDEYLVIEVKVVDKEELPPDDPLVILSSHQQALEMLGQKVKDLTRDVAKLQHVVSQLVSHVVVFAKSFDEEKPDDD